MTRKRTTTSRVASSRVDDFKIIRGIGPLYEKYLHDAGVRTFAQLAKLSPEDAATQIPNLSASQIRKQGWVLQARTLASKKTEAKSRRKKSTVPTTSQHYENFTVEFLLNEKNKLRRLRILHVQSGDVETWANWKQEEVSQFLARHTGAQIPEEKTQKLEGTISKPKSTVKETKSARSSKQKTRHHSSTRKSVEPRNKTQPKKTPQKIEAVKVRKVKKDQAKSARPKAKRSLTPALKSGNPVAKPASKGLSQKPEAQTVPEVKKEQAKSVARKTRQSRSKVRKSAKPIVNVPTNKISQKPETSLTPRVSKVQVESVKPERKENRSLVRKSVDKPIAETSPKEIFQKPEAPIASKVEQEQARSAPLKTGQVNNSAPILFGPAAEVLPKRFLQKSPAPPIPEENKRQANSSQSETHLAIEKTKPQMGAIRLLQWNNLMINSDQPVQSLPHDQTFDIKLTLDISNLPMATKSQLDISGTLLAKKLGSHERRVIGETQAILPYSPTINLRVGILALEQGLYRLEAEVKLNDVGMMSLPKRVETILQGGLFQVY